MCPGQLDGGDKSAKRHFLRSLAGWWKEWIYHERRRGGEEERRRSGGRMLRPAITKC